MCPSLNEAGEFNSLNEYACLRERERERERERVCMLEGERVCVSLCVYLCVSGTEKERERVSVCVSVCE